MADYIEVRASSLPRYSDCPRSQASRLFWPEIVAEGYSINSGTPSVAAAMGTALHAMMAELFKQKLQFGMMDVQDAFAARRKSFVDEIEKGCVYDDTTPHIETAEKQLVAMAEAFLPIAQLTDPLDFETKLQAWVSPLGNQAVPILLTGTRDVRDVRLEIHDHKTGAQLPSCHAQLGAYALLSELNEEEVSAVRVNYVPRLGVRKLAGTAARSVRFDLEECRQSAWNTLREIQRHHEQWLESKNPWAFPANPYSQSCTQKYCSVWGTDFCKVGKQ